jgi:hypothetical protein
MYASIVLFGFQLRNGAIGATTLGMNGGLSLVQQALSPWKKHQHGA